MEIEGLRPGEVRDPSDGHAPRQGVRHIRARLVLALLATALLPVLVVVPALRWVADDGYSRTTPELTADATRSADRIGALLQPLRQSLRAEAAADPARIAVGAPGIDTRAILRPRLEGLLADYEFLLTAAVADLSGEDVVRVPNEASIPPSASRAPDGRRLVASAMAAPSTLVVSPVGRVGSEATVTIVVGLAPADGAPAGALRVVLSVPRLVAAAKIPNADLHRQMTLVDQSTASSLLQVEGSSQPPTLDRLVGRFIDPVDGLAAEGWSRVPVQGFGHWVVGVDAPFTFHAIQLPQVLTVLLLCVAVGILIVWTARRVLGPAIALEASSVRMGDLYEAERMASLTDHLTGLGNHRAFQEELARHFEHLQRYGTPLGLLLFDLDEFKQVNDQLGHGVGDDLLREVGRLTRETKRAVDSAFRTGGDEFAVILAQTDAAGSQEFADRLLRRFLTDRASGPYQRPISFSGGVAAAPEHTLDKVELQTRADAALYRSKRAGRTLITTFDPEVDQTLLDDASRERLSARVAEVTRSRGLTAVYQPIVQIATGRAIAYEGLIRPVAGSGFDSPTALFTAAEATGRIAELDQACLEVVVTGARDLPADVFVSLNISPRTFESPEFTAGGFLTLLQRAGVDPRRIILEITERQPIEDLDRLQHALNACRAAGIQVAADDVGAGNNGLRMLSQIQFDVMKIDLSLVQVAAGREPVTSVLTSLIELGRRWKALVVAEGVETPGQLDMVRALGIEAAQGYLIARPGPLVVDATFDLGGITDPLASRRLGGLAPGVGRNPFAGPA